MSKNDAAQPPAAWAWILCLPGLFGLMALFLFVIRLGRGEPTFWDFGWGWPALFLDVLLIAVFAAHHSTQARRRATLQRAHALPGLFRAWYVFWSGILTGAIVLVWQPVPGEFLWEVSAWWTAGPMGMALLLLTWSVWSLDGFAFLGLRSGTAAENLHIRGPYRWVRHPQMLGTLIFLWAHPVLSPTLALLSGFLTAYLFLALPWEERDLERTFGRSYHEYRLRVPALVPWKLPAPGGSHADGRRS